LFIQTQIAGIGVASSKIRLIETERLNQYLLKNWLQESLRRFYGGL